jgi:hypothetical protein
MLLSFPEVLNPMQLFPSLMCWAGEQSHVAKPGRETVRRTHPLLARTRRSAALLRVSLTCRDAVCRTRHR